MISSDKIKIAFAVIVIQVLFFIFWAMSEEGYFDRGDSRYIIVETRPVDPRDLLSGNYFILRYPMDSPPAYENYDSSLFSYKERNRQIYTLLKKDASSDFHIPYKISFEPFTVEEINKDIEFELVMIKGIFKNTRFMDFSIGRFYINENMKEPSRGDKTTVSLKINPRHKASIEQVFVDGVEYFSTQN